jgi:hypothetical protein
MKQTVKLKQVGVIVVLFQFLSFFVICCSYDKTKEEGYKLAEIHCQSCHRLPDPDLLDKKTWANYVMPKMGGLLGFRYLGSNAYFEDGKSPEVMPLSEWKKIVNYYVNNALGSLKEAPDKKDIQIGVTRFEVTFPSFNLKDPATTYVGILPGQHQINLADGISKYMYALSESGSLKDSIKVDEGVVNIYGNGAEINTLAMGVLYPSDEKKGSLVVHNVRTKESSTLIDSLQRPVYAEYADLNNDTLQDIIICEFGNVSGQLSWFENRGNRNYVKHILRPLPGAVRTQVIDLNKDGRLDIVALMAQGDEGVFIYYNKGGERFEEKRALQFHPSYGSNYFELTDINQDGHQDILSTNGDNGDYPPILKPYHGIRMYLNDGHNQFTENKFLPMNGACKAMARDFDGDGDLDIASISYFPDYDHTPEESFVYWENSGNLSFRPYSFKVAWAGRWLTMDAGDLDGDGDIDIVLGNAKFPLGNIPDWLMKKWNQNAPSLLILKNR